MWVCVSSLCFSSKLNSVGTSGYLNGRTPDSDSLHNKTQMKFIFFVFAGSILAGQVHVVSRCIVLDNLRLSIFSYNKFSYKSGTINATIAGPVLLP